jgi:DNA-binding NarL/FixJ family response regulator
MSVSSILIADSSTIGKIGLCSVVNSLEGFEVVGEVQTSQDLLDLLKDGTPDLLIIDFLSEGFDIDVVAKIKRDYSRLNVLAITPMQSSQTFVHAMKAGVDSYIKKCCDLDEIKEAIQLTSKGTSYFCGKILDAIRKASIEVEDLNNVSELPCDAVELSKREKEVLCLITDGHTNTEIAEILFLSTHTITTHRKNIMIKLGVKNTAGIVMYAVKSGIVSPNKFLFQTP